LINKGLTNFYILRQTATEEKLCILKDGLNEAVSCCVKGFKR